MFVEKLHASQETYEPKWKEKESESIVEREEREAPACDLIVADGSEWMLKLSTWKK